MKKLLAFLLLIPSIGVCSSLQLSGSGTGSLVVSAPVASAMTVYPATATIIAPFGIAASTVSVSSNTILPGTTFYQNGNVSLGTVTGGTWNGSALTSTYLPTNTAYLDQPQSWTATQTHKSSVTVTGATLTAGVLVASGVVTLGGSGNSVTISSNIILSGATSYAAPFPYVALSSMTCLNWRVLQSSEITVTISSSIAGTTPWASTTIKGTLTLRDTNSRVRIHLTSIIGGNINGSCFATILRNGTNLESTGNGFTATGQTLGNIGVPLSIDYIDTSPGGGSVTYTLGVYTNSAACSINANAATSVMILDEESGACL